MNDTIPPDRFVWHPFAQMRAFFEEDPPTIVRGEGCELFDQGGRRYLDGISSLWCNVHGHRRPEIDEAIREQLRRIAHTTLLGLRTPSAEALARRLAEVAPEGLRWTFYSESGSTAVEIALKMAFQYWQNRGEKGRTRFVTLGDAYHGDTIGSVSLGGIELFHSIFHPLLFDSIKVPAPHCKRCSRGLRPADCALRCAAEVEEALSANSGTIAAVVVEPLVQGAAGIITHPHGFLERVREACDAHDVLLICDEVATGFGRTGRMFACEHEGVRPDLMCLAKGLSGGYLPLAATMATDEVFEAFLGEHHEARHFFHGHTYTGNALGCAAALASLEIFRHERVIESLGPKGSRLAAALEPVFEVRQRGLMTGIELSEDPEADRPFAPERRLGHQVTLAARRRGVIIRPLGDVVVLMPALAMTEEQIDELVTVTRQSIDEVTGR